MFYTLGPIFFRASPMEVPSKILKPKNSLDSSSDRKYDSVKVKSKFDDPNMFKNVSKEELISNGILVQVRQYKNTKQLPIVGGKTVETKKGRAVTFYKRRHKIWLEVAGQIYFPAVEPDHIAGIFKDFTSDELLRNDRGEKSDLSNCPLCNGRFVTERELMSHCASCNGESRFV